MFRFNVTYYIQFEAIESIQPVGYSEIPDIDFALIFFSFALPSVVTGTYFALTENQINDKKSQILILNTNSLLQDLFHRKCSAVNMYIGTFLN